MKWACLYGKAKLTIVSDTHLKPSNLEKNWKCEFHHVLQFRGNCTKHRCPGTFFDESIRLKLECSPWKLQEIFDFFATFSQECTPNHEDYRRWFYCTEQTIN